MATLRDELSPDSSRSLRQDEIAERMRKETEHDPSAELGHFHGGHGDSLEREIREHRRRCPGCGKRLKKGVRQCPVCFCWANHERG